VAFERHSEVNEYRLLIGLPNHNVAGLQIEMKDVLFVDVPERCEDLFEDADGGCGIEPAA
jgi:hypothetical protein